MTHRLGKTDARPDAIKFKFSDYFDRPALPVPPQTFGRRNLVSDWGMLGNDRFGNCVLAGGDHETMLFNAEAGQTVPFDAGCALGDYAAITGFSPANPSSDQGTDMQEAASYRRKTGLIDSNGKRHLIDAYIAIDLGNLDELMTAVYLFGAVGVGVQFPSTAMKQFDQKMPWSFVQGSKIEGGHYVPCIDRTESGNLVVLSWGREQEMEPDFFRAYNDENVAYLSIERLKNSLSPEGFDPATLLADLNSLPTGA